METQGLPACSSKRYPILPHWSGPLVTESTLQNAMLYANFVKKVHRIDPGFDLQVIDRHLEPSEALGQLRERHHLGYQAKAEQGGEVMKEYKGFLYDTGIKHPRMQSFVMRQEKPPTQEHLDLLTYVMQQRPHRNVKLDIARKAKRAKTVAQYAKHPNRYDVPGVDTPGSKFVADWF